MCHTMLCRIQRLLYASLSNPTIRVKNRVVHVLGRGESQFTPGGKLNFCLVDPNHVDPSKAQFLVLRSSTPDRTSWHLPVVSDLHT